MKRAVLGVAMFGLATFSATLGFAAFSTQQSVIKNISSEQVSGVSEMPTASFAAFPKAKSKDTTLLFGGDVMLSRSVGEKIRIKGTLFPFEKIQDTFLSADVSFINLEAPFSDQGPRTSLTDTLRFKVEPEALEGIYASGIDIVSLANNHFADAGSHGVDYTVKWLDTNDVQHVGGGRNLAEAEAPVIFLRNGLRVGFVAAQGVLPSVKATTKKAGTLWWDDKALEAVRRLRPFVDVLVVSIHAGTEYQLTPTASQVSFSHKAIDAGADIVVGHHPYVVQPIERYKKGIILYSLGNLIFDQCWSKETQEGLVLKVILRKDSGKASSLVKKIEFLPVKIELCSQPSFLTGEEKAKFLDKYGLTK